MQSAPAGTTVIVLIATLFGGVMLSRTPAYEKQPNEAVSTNPIMVIDWQDVPENVGIKGKLGLNLGTIATVEGYWFVERHIKGDRKIFQIEKVNDVEIADESIARFNVWDVDVPNSPDWRIEDGARWRVEAFEAAVLDGIPPGHSDVRLRSGIRGFGLYPRLNIMWRKPGIAK